MGSRQERKDGEDKAGIGGLDVMRMMREVESDYQCVLCFLVEPGGEERKQHLVVRCMALTVEQGTVGHTIAEVIANWPSHRHRSFFGAVYWGLMKLTELMDDMRNPFPD